MERAQKEYYLNEKLKAIQKELGRGERAKSTSSRVEDRYRGNSQGVHEKAVQESSAWN